jgi:uncharacterized membrane protein
MRLLPLIFVVIFIAGLVGAADNSGTIIDNVLLKLSLHQGESIDKIVTLTATEDSNFALTLENLKGASVADKQFSLTKGDTRNVVIHFDATGVAPEIYIGSVKIVDEKETNVLPVLFEVESQNTLFDVNVDIPPQYKDIPVGEKLISQVKVFDLTSGGTSSGQGPTRVVLEYVIYSLDGKIVSSQSEDAVVSVQTQLTKTFSFPEDIKTGDYVLVTLVKKDSSVGLASSLFTIHEATRGSLFSGGANSGIIYFLVGVIVFFLLFIFLFIYFVKDRDKMILELRNYHSEEMHKMEHFLAAQQRVLNEKGTVHLQDVQKEIHTKLKAVHERQERREREFRALEEKGDRNAMQHKLSEWKKEGYNTRLLEYKLKGLSENEMRTLLSEWKHRYGRI